MRNFKIIPVNRGGNGVWLVDREIYCGRGCISSGPIRFAYYTVKVWKSFVLRANAVFCFLFFFLFSYYYFIFFPLLCILPYDLPTRIGDSTVRVRCILAI